MAAPRLPRKILIYILFVPCALWYWPQWAVRCFIAAFREGYNKDK